MADIRCMPISENRMPIGELFKEMKRAEYAINEALEKFHETTGIKVTDANFRKHVCSSGYLQYIQLKVELP